MKYISFNIQTLYISRLKTPEALPEHVFEIDAEVEEKERDEVIIIPAIYLHLHIVF